MSKFFKALLESKKTLHPDGAKTITVFVTAQLKKDAEILAEDELKFWDAEHFHAYKKPKMIELDEIEGQSAIDAYQASKPKGELVSDSQPQTEPDEDDGNDFGNIDDVHRVIVNHKDYKNCFNPFEPKFFVTLVLKNIGQAVRACDLPISYKFIANRLAAMESMRELTHLDFVTDNLIKPLYEEEMRLKAIEAHCETAFPNVNKATLYSAGQNAPDYSKPKNYIVTSRYYLKPGEFIRLGLGIYGDSYLSSFDFCIEEKETSYIHSISGNINEFRHGPFKKREDAIYSAFYAAIEALHDKAMALNKQLLHNDAKAMQSHCDALASLNLVEKVALFEKNKNPAYLALIPQLCVMPVSMREQAEKVLPEKEKTLPDAAPATPKPSESDTGIIFAGAIDYSGKAMQNANAFYSGNIYCYPPIKETKPVAPAETKPFAPAEIHQPAEKEIKPQPVPETKSENPDLGKAPDLTPDLDDKNSEDLSVFFDGGKDDDFDIFEYLLDELEIKPELSQLEKDIQEQNAKVSKLASGETVIFDTLPNAVYHGSNGISSTKIKDSCISLMYYNGVYNTGTIEKPRGDHFDVGNLAHTLILEPEKVELEYKKKPTIPEPTQPQRDKFDKWVKAGKPDNQNLKPTDKVIEAVESWIEAGRPENQNLKPSDTIISKVENFASDPENNPAPTENQRQQYAAWNNAGFPEPYKDKPTDKQIADFENWENAGRPGPYNGKPNDECIKRCDFWDKFTADNKNLIIVDNDNWQIAENMAYAVRNHTIASKFINHPQRKSERSYYKIDELTGLLIKARPDIEVGAVLADVKTISLRGNPDEKWLVAELKREIRRRKYHLSAAMYLDVTGAKQFVWIFVNKEPGYHWVAVVKMNLQGIYDADENYQPSFYEQGLEIYRDRLAAIKQAYDSNQWPEPLTIQDIVEI